MYKNIVRPFLFRFNTDAVHESTIRWTGKVANSPFLKRVASGLYNFQHPSLRQKVLGMTFRNPVGLAAGFDKNGTLAPAMEAIGFGFVEVGSITANPSTGNPKPRSFRLPEDESLINRMGLNNDGAATIRKRLEKLSLSVPLGVNIAKTHDPSITGERALEDYLESFRLAVPVADYITLNISCP
ncbi:MAG: quinone-dependent dihydroorotate dehydrogenase, partial [Balneolaceae bacterium]